MASAAIGLPNFVENAAKWVQSAQIIVAIPDPDTVMLCARDSHPVGYIRETALKSNYTGAINLTPCVLLLDNGRWSMLAKRE
jgi:hypothetical protein